LLTFVYQAQTNSRRVPSTIVPAGWFCLFVSFHDELATFFVFVSPALDVDAKTLRKHYATEIILGAQRAQAERVSRSLLLGTCTDLGQVAGGTRHRMLVLLH
jgi:hypothetical protein